MPDGYQLIEFSFSALLLGTFEEKFYFHIDGTEKKVEFVVQGRGRHEFLGTRYPAVPNFKYPFEILMSTDRYPDSHADPWFKEKLSDRLSSWIRLIST